MTAQVSTKSVALASVVRDPAFRQGFADRIRGRQLDYNHEWQGNRRKTATDKAWAPDPQKRNGAGRRAQVDHKMSI